MTTPYDPVQQVETAADDIAPAGLSRRTARGATAVYAGQAVRLILQVGSVSVLARLLTPSDYGLIAIVLAVVSVGEIFRDSGLSSAAVQAPTLSKSQRATLFWVNTALGALLAVAAIGAAPLIAKIFGSHDLVGVTRALAFTFLINGASAQYRASLLRHLRFTVLTVSVLISQAVGILVAITFAWLGAGYWALVAQQLAQAVVGLAIMVGVSGWLPSRPGPLSSVRPMLRYGWNLAASQLIAYLNTNVDTFTINFRFGTAPLGLYNRGFQLLMRPLGQMRIPTTNVAVPVLSRINHDVERSNSYIVRGQLLLGYTLVPVLAVAFAASVPIVRIFLGPGWLSTAPVIAALAAAGAFETLAYVGYWVYQARGLTRQLVGFTLICLVAKVVCVVAGSQFGLTGVAVGYACAGAFNWPLSIFWLSRLTPFPRVALWKGAGRILTCAFAAAICGRLAADAAAPAGSVAALLAATGIVLAVYLAALLLPAVRRDLTAVLKLAGKAVRR